jgi:hypothetical protein
MLLYFLIYGSETWKLKKIPTSDTVASSINYLSSSSSNFSFKAGKEKLLEKEGNIINTNKFLTGHPNILRKWHVF